MSLWTMQKKFRARTSIFPAVNNNPRFKTRDASSRAAPHPCALSSLQDLAATSLSRCGYQRCWHHSTWRKAVQVPYSKKLSPVLLSFPKGTISKVQSFQSQEDITKKHSWQVPLGEGRRRAVLSTASELRADNLANEKFGRLDLKPTH